MTPVLEVRDLRVQLRTDDGIVTAVDGVSYRVEAGRTLGIVGESGSGKSISSLTVMGLTRFLPNAQISGEVLLNGRDLLSASDDELRQARGGEIAMIFQDPLSSLHPYYRVGAQLAEAIRAHRRIPRRQALARAVELLALVGVPDPKRRAEAYPHELSGGTRQRVMIAMALANDPQMLIADEPTTALDATVQAQILDELLRLQEELGMALVLITHDMGVVAQVAHEVAVMYAGQIVEQGDVDTILTAPEHPYTWGLLTSIPRLDRPRGSALTSIPGRPPSLIQPPSGCRFHPRCAYARASHDAISPQLAPVPGDDRHQVACLLESEERQALWRELQRAATTPAVR
jgi:peptide/nickel transport system ATP-binding protein